MKDKIVDLSFASNQQFNEGYFTLLTEDFSSFLPSGIEAETSIFQLVFCTDETDNYDLYKIDIPQNENLDSFLLQASENGKTPITELTEDKLSLNLVSTLFKDSATDLNLSITTVLVCLILAVLLATAAETTSIF